MKKLSTLTLLVILGLGSILYPACKKEQKPETGKKTARTFSGAMPKVEGGLLSFDDYDAYEAFGTFLMDEVDKSDGERSEDEILQEIEDGLGFTSLRKTALAEFERLNVVGWKDPKYIPEEHWITSKITRALLNNDREVKIADQILHYVNEDYMVTIDASRAELIAAVKTLPLTATVGDLLELDPGRYYMGITGLRTHEVFNTEPLPGGSGPAITWRLNGAATQQNPCLELRTVRLSGLQLWDNIHARANRGKYYINWGDGSAVEMVETSPSGSSVAVPVTKVYATSGTKTITVSVMATDPISSGSTYVVVKTFTVNVIEKAMCHDFSRMDTRDYSVGPTTFIRGHLKYDAWHNWFRLRDECKILSYTECYVTDDGVNWHRFRANWITLCSSIQTVPRKEDCSFVDSFSITIYRCAANTNQRYAESGVYERFHWQILNARHEASFHGSAVGWYHIVNACE